MSDDRDRVFREISATGTRDYALIDSNCMVNTGSAAQRLSVPVQIDKATLTTVATYASPAWTSNLYREISLWVRSSTTGGTVVFKLRGVAAGYSSKDNGAADASQVSVIEASAAWDISLRWLITTDGLQRPCYYFGSKAPTAAAITATINGNGSTIDVSSNVTGLDITFSNNVTGLIEVWGIPT
jgi:hypothetical protein